jgi:hypothetical protein
MLSWDMQMQVLEPRINLGAQFDQYVNTLSNRRFHAQMSYSGFQLLLQHLSHVEYIHLARI